MRLQFHKFSMKSSNGSLPFILPTIIHSTHQKFLRISSTISAGNLNPSVSLGYLFEKMAKPVHLHQVNLYVVSGKVIG